MGLPGDQGVFSPGTLTTVVDPLFYKANPARVMYSVFGFVLFSEVGIWGC